MNILLKFILNNILNMTQKTQTLNKMIQIDI